MTVVAYPEDRKRLLEHGEMQLNIYSSRPAEDVARDTYRTMTAAAEFMGLILSEPILEVGEKDWWGGRYVTVRAGVFDALKRESPRR